MSTIENPTLLKIKSVLRNRFPVALLVGQRCYARSIGFRDERSYLRGDRKVQSGPPSIAMLCPVRGGTQITESVLAQLYQEAGGKALNLGKYFFWAKPAQVTNIRDVAWLCENIDERNHSYGNFGPFPEEVTLPNLRYFCSVRDPRDVLVSHYYSVRDSHTPSRNTDIEKVKRVKELTLDQYVRLEEQIADAKTYLKQAIWAQKRANVFFLRYENLIEDPSEVLSRFVEFAELSVDSGTVMACAETHFPRKDPANEVENTLRHRRSGVWGQFREKLQPETQTFLWQQFQSELTALGYSRDGYESCSAR